MTGQIAIALGVLTVVFSGVSFVMLGLDKRKASRGRSRITERALHLVEALGGWPGSWAGQRVWRHKTQNRRFRTVTVLWTVAHLAVWGFLIWQAFLAAD